ncbi:hypothetical protein ABBQ38_003826 [Trebouxia sp. C0009 RCD-2024]
MRSCCSGPNGSICHQRAAVCLGSVRPRASQATAVRRITEAADRGVHPRRICSPATAGSTDRESNYDSVSFRQDSGSSASTSSVIDVNDKAQTESKMDELQQFLRAELDRIFGGGSVSRERYAADMRFSDPVVSYASLDGFIFNVQALRTAFTVQFNLLDIGINGPNEIKTRWTMSLKSRFLPWQPNLVFSGCSYYTIDTAYGKIAGQRDVWDAIQDNSSPSIEGIAHVIKQLTTIQLTPSLDSPHYTVLKKTKEYEIRQYSPYLVAETNMPSDARPAGGDGFTELAGYIFGGNSSKTKMEMTTPVISTGGQQGAHGDKMQFPIERKYGEDPETLPLPNDSKVTRKMQEGGILAATSFGGIPLDFEVTEAERKLRAALLLDGHKAQEGYQLARYNDPFTLPFLRRNEVLIGVDNFELK